MSKTASAVFVCLLVVRPALAQQAPGAWTGRARAAFTVGVQADSAGLSQSYSLVKYVEPAPISAELPSATVPWFDGGLAVRLFGNAGVGFALSMASRTGEAEVSATVPHPFFFGRPRPIAGVASVEHRELTVHLSGVYRMAARVVEVAVAGGLSVFNVEQDVVTDVVYAQAFPYETASFTRADLTRHSTSKAGYHGGVDITWKLGPRWGIGGLVRYSRATGSVEGPAVDAGGLQTAAA